MERSKSFTDLIVWRKAHEFVLSVYRLTANFPKSETYGLVSQFRRAVVSIPANISEGFVKKGKADKLRYYNIAQGSIQECKYYIILSKDLNYSKEQNTIELLDKVAKLLQAYINTKFKLLTTIDE